MDRTKVSGTLGRGSIPFEATKEEKRYVMVFSPLLFLVKANRIRCIAFISFHLPTASNSPNLFANVMQAYYFCSKGYPIHLPN